MKQVFSLAVLLVTLTLHAQRVSGVREADRVCAQCHRQIVSTYLLTPMANSSGLAEDRFQAGSFRNPVSGVSYSLERTGNAVWLKYTTSTEPAVTASERLEYFLGSGHLGSTYLYEKNGFWFESPAAYYAELSAYAMKPGYQAAREAPSALTVDPSCLRCHMSAVTMPRAGTDNLYSGAPFGHTGITCESCHGDTSAHVASGGKSSVVNPIKLSPVRRDGTCLVCHLEGDTSVERSGRSILDFRPGDDLSDYVSYFTYRNANATHRAVSETEQFLSSRCRVASGPAMSCMSCHNPHSSPAPAERAVYFRARCLTCHSQPGFATTHFPATPDCTSCHMPQTGSRNIAHVAWTDHRILRIASQPDDSLGSALRSSPVLEPFLSPGAGDRDRALAAYNLIVTKGLHSLVPAVYRQLTALPAADQTDPAVLRALGVVAGMKGDPDAAERYDRQLLALDPESLAGRTNLGTLLARRGDLRGAVALWEPAFQQNGDVPQLGENLAKAQCELNDRSKAIQTLRTVLAYSPGLTRSRVYLEILSTSPTACLPAVRPHTQQAP